MVDEIQQTESAPTTETTKSNEQLIENIAAETETLIEQVIQKVHDLNESFTTFETNMKELLALYRMRRESLKPKKPFNPEEECRLERFGELGCSGVDNRY